jgi:hypothetical protein
MIQPGKNRILIIIITILLLANIATLAALMLNRKSGVKETKKDRMMLFLKNDVGYSDTQLALYDSLHKRHISNTEHIVGEMHQEKENRFKGLINNDFSDSAIQLSSSAVSGKQQEMEIHMLRHLKQIRNIGTYEQKAKFDSLFFKVMSKKKFKNKISN